MNEFLMARVVPALVSLTPIVQIICQYVCIKLHDQISMPGFLMFPLILVDAVVINGFVFTLASAINSTSAKLLETHVKRTVEFGGKRSVLAREIKACGVLKIKFGSNYIDNGTPLAIQNFCLNQTLSLLLLSAGRMRGNVPV